MKHFSISMKTRLILNFSIVILTGAFLSAIIGVQMIGNTIIKQAQDKVRLDLNSAREVFQREISKIENTVRLTAIRYFLKDPLLKKERDREKLTTELQNIMKMESLDMLHLTDNMGNVIIRARSPGNYGDRLNREVINWVITKKTTTVSTQIISREELEKEGKDIAEQARIKLIDTPQARPRADVSPEETSGMIIEAAAPVFDYNGRLIGVLCGAKLLNRSYEIVDRVKDIVYKGKKYKGKDIGTATIFQDDLRVSTNVRKADGTRAIGTRVSKEVYNQVILKGIPWTDRAFVVKDWYITAYEPIRNLAGDIIGMLYVGILEAPYIDLRKGVLFNFLAVALLSVILLIVIAYFTATRTTKPLNELIIATKKVAQGDLSHRVQIKSQDEIGDLAESFNQMIIDLENVTRRYQALHRTLEDKVREKTRALKEAQDQLIQSEKLSSLGKMAAGVAHEINNPLTSVLINSHLLEEKWGTDNRFKENLDLIIDETTRCSNIVKDLLHFSRQTQTVKSLIDINDGIKKALLLLKNQIQLRKVKVKKHLDKTLPKIIIDIHKIEQVFTNVILNALDAIPEDKGGELSIESNISSDGRYVEIKFQDNGCGIPKEQLGKIFDPFFTTKGTKGTGLGLSVSYGIVQQHGGKMTFQSEPGHGTTVSIYLPINNAEKSHSGDKKEKKIGIPTIDSLKYKEEKNDI
jgi:two-component system NtrC family sensor kinase